MRKKHLFHDLYLLFNSVVGNQLFIWVLGNYFLDLVAGTVKNRHHISVAFDIQRQIESHNSHTDNTNLLFGHSLLLAGDISQSMQYFIAYVYVVNNQKKITKLNDLPGLTRGTICPLLPSVSCASPALNDLFWIRHLLFIYLSHPLDQKLVSIYFDKQCILNIS